MRAESHQKRARRARSQRVVLAIVLYLIVGNAVYGILSESRASGASSQQDASPGAAPAIANPHGPLRVGCEACHTADAWDRLRTPLGFDHASTGFGLAGKHDEAECRDCHRTTVFSHVGTSCADCHRDVHDGRNGVRCDDCHSPERWVQRPEAARQHAESGFPLLGMHRLVECSRCHAGLDEANDANVSIECIGCHAAEYAGTQRPNHSAAGYSTQCEDCHDVAALRWESSAFDHASTGFPLAGTHRTLECAACHGAGFTPLGADCVSCHEAEYLATREPDHSTAGFSTDCARCHTANRWSDARFAHTVFPLRGAHGAISCNSCHGDGVYQGLPSDCFSCHEPAYVATTNPDHAAARFPTDCAACHSDVSWQPAQFDHDGLYFRIDSGAHRGKWEPDCTVCHVNTSNYAEFSCLGCHEHDRTRMDDKHSEQRDYQYESGACYECHRNG